MKIAIDVTRAIIEGAGIGRYTNEIAHALIDSAPSDQFVIFSTHYNDSPAKTKIFESFKASNVTLKRIRIPGQLKEVAWQMPFNWLAKTLAGCDALFAPSHLEVMIGAKIPQIVTIHDLTTVLFPDQRGARISRKLTKNAFRACLKADRIICISNSTRHDLLKSLPQLKDKCQVIYLGAKKFPGSATALPQGLKKDSYILSVGTIEPRKNLIGLFRAYARLSKETKERFPLVLVGGKGWNEGPIFDEYKKLKIEPFVRFTGFLSDGELASVYKNCRLFCYLSIYEGFGLPPLEAMSFARPVLVSNTSSLPEVVGSAGELVDPNDYDQIAQKLEKMLLDDTILNKYSKLAMMQAAKFSWNKAAQETLSAIRSIK